jgi:hypothetical protein
VGNKKVGYIEKLTTVKGILKRMFEIEDGFSSLEQNSYFDSWWKLGSVEILINDIRDDVYYLTVSVLPKIEDKKRRVMSCINYYYTIKGKEIERDMTLTLDLPAFQDRGKKVLDELISILNYGNLVLKKNKNAP